MNIDFVRRACGRMMMLLIFIQKILIYFAVIVSAHIHIFFWILSLVYACSTVSKSVLHTSYILICSECIEFRTFSLILKHQQQYFIDSCWQFSMLKYYSEEKERERVRVREEEKKRRANAHSGIHCVYTDMNSRNDYNHKLCCLPFLFFFFSSNSYYSR